MHSIVCYSSKQNILSEGYFFDIFKVLNMFIIVKITKSAKFRSQFRRQDEDEAEGGELIEVQNRSAGEENINIGQRGIQTKWLSF